MPKADFKRINALAGQRHDPEARTALMKAGYDLVAYIINWKRYFIKRFGAREDLVQDGMIGFYQAVCEWDGSGKFTNWAVLCVDREIMTAIKTANRHKHRVLSDANTLDAPVHRGKHGGEGRGEDRVDAWNLPDTSGLGANPGEVVAERSGASPLIGALCEGLTDLERTAFLLFRVQHRSYSETAVILRTTAKSIDNAVQRARRRMIERAAKLANDDRFSDVARAILARVAAGVRRQVGRRQVGRRKAS